MRVNYASVSLSVSGHVMILPLDRSGALLQLSERSKRPCDPGQKVMKDNVFNRGPNRGDGSTLTGDKSLRCQQLPTAAAVKLPIVTQQEIMLFFTGMPVLSLDKPLAPLKVECHKWEAMKEAVAVNA